MVCQDAPELLKLRRQIAENIGLTPAAAGELIKAIDKIRWAHQEKHDCFCWDGAIVAARRVA